MSEGHTPEQKFDDLFYKMEGIYQYGRTARFDMLCFLGDLRIFDIKPGSVTSWVQQVRLEEPAKLWDGGHQKNYLS